ncbi:MAG: c-type cytochrome [Planctomycetales bacterium]|nr:c-type cytochrome [Planctomycetales bacterium]
MALLFLLASGCSQEVELSYTPREELNKLPQKQQEQIAEGLVNYFGTPRFPKYMEVAPDDKQPADAKEPLLVDRLTRGHLQHGREVYTRQCAGCHGTTGDGQGPAAQHLNPPPRDYRLGRFKFTSTPRGDKPRRADLARIIRRGAKGTSMPTFRWMAQEDLEAVIDYVTLLSSRGELEFRLMKTAEQDLSEEDNVEPPLVAEQAKLIAQTWADADKRIVRPLTPEPQYTQESINAGAKAFVQLNCYKCHGRDGRGNKAFNVGKDDWGRIAYAADLTTGMLHGGRRPTDIYRRIYSGINATPMPAFAQPDSGKGETETQRSETIWNLSHFVTSIVEGKPLPAEIIDAAIKEQIKNQPATAPAAASTSGAE